MEKLLPIAFCCECHKPIFEAQSTLWITKCFNDGGFGYEYFHNECFPYIRTALNMDSISDGWTKEMPKRGGWYWFRGVYKFRSEVIGTLDPVVVAVDEAGRCYGAGVGEPLFIQRGEWQGPIKPLVKESACP